MSPTPAERGRSAAGSSGPAPLAFASRSRTDLLVRAFVAAQLAFLALVLWIAAKPGLVTHPFAQGLAIFGAIHLDVLGWVTMTMLGAYLNLIPVILHPAKISPWASRLLFWLFALAVAGFVAGFAAGLVQLLAAAATLLVLALGGYGVVLAVAVWPLLRRSKVPATAWAFAGAPVFLCEAAILGVVMALGLGQFLPSGVLALAPHHMTAAIGGWFALTVMGAAYRLVPLFFASARGQDEPRWGHAAVVLLVVGLLALQAAAWAGAESAAPAAGSVGGTAWLGWAAYLLLALAAVAFLADMARMIHRRVHQKREPVTVLTIAAWANAAAAAAALLIGVFGGGFPGWRIAAAYLGLFAAPTFLIFGQLSRILVFLTTLDLAEWARDHGETRKTWYLSRPRLAYAGYVLLQAAVVGFVGLVVVAAGGFGSTAAGAGAGGDLVLGSWPAIAAHVAGGLQAVGGLLLCASLWPAIRVRRHLTP